MGKYLDIKPQHHMLVRSERLLLRPVITGDLYVLHRMRLNPQVMRFMPGVENEQEALKSYSVRRIEFMMMEDQFSFAVVLPNQERRPSGSEASKEETVIGFVGITQPPEVFYIFDEEYWGHGYATEALQSFLNTYWATFPSGLITMDEKERDHLEAHVHDGNDCSERVATNCGFVHVRNGFSRSHGGEIGNKIYRVQRPSSA
ncbi:hypothetical protein VPNG_09285 [Cytospora leucostoma]|uniref:N-acetyltransferase domain-containing protein n=1 Tax=Cytospora leucostoma TaxID=1230097 RepID=A0A423VUR6_9PEZI|nr:hypothetical protein VPNG_09285 [Cytospora leucostoma]